ncbi:hypothetical protein HPB49_020960 [Dermacentor silvarum]|uniref:Uncharacterized protein n=1 Tax=Dermacentor silvarum TaxID=543639 RepID=A0ACB8D005_DERSI|nr:hypothetical protein HPB49_020960 [Dermacentor silvarum]
MQTFHSPSNRSEKANVIVKFKFETNACQISEEKMRALKEQFYARLRETTKHINGLCDPSRGCTMEKVSVKCRSKNFSSSTTTATNGQRPERRLTKRQAQGGDGEDEFELVISFDFPLGTGFNATQLIDGCEDCKNTSLVHPSDAETTALGRAIEAALSEVVGTTVDRTFPGASLVETTHAVKSACQRGQVSNGLRCVNCPVGTYYYETACVTCPIGTYSDKEAAESCVPCPDNKTTLEGKTASVSDCLALCAPGTWSRTGKEPCIACDPHSYQDQVGQLSCKKCTLGLSTGYWGAASSSECQALNYCSEMQPCSNGSTCVDEATGFRCVCPEGLRGPRCEQDVDDCEPGLCLNGGTCVDGFNAFSCLCPSGYMGAACEINVDDCASGPCFNGATCIDGIDAFACKCAKGFTGKLCDATFHDCTTKPCRNGGSCFESVTGFRCCCPKGFRGKTCELVEHACLPNPCRNNGTCKKKSDSFQCACAPGFAGRRCERKVNNCASAPCLNGGTCVDGLASFSCRCHGLYTGDTCADVLSSQFTLHFRDASVLDYATVPVQRYLRAVTLSFHMKTTQTKGRGTVFSYAFVDPRTKQVQDNAFTISDPSKLLLYVYGESYDTKVVANDGLWHHCAVTWESADGQWIFYWDQQEKARNFRAVGEVVFPGVLVVGQDQDRVGTAFSGVEAYSGHVAELNVWDYAMSPSEVRELSQACRLAGNVVSWPELRLAATNGIVIDDDWELCKDTYGGQDRKQAMSCHSASASFENQPPKCTLLPNSTLVTFDGLSFPLNKKRNYTVFQDCYHGKFYGYLSLMGNEVTVRVYIHCLTATLFASGRALVGDRDVQRPHHEDTIMSIDFGNGSNAVELRTHHGLVVAVRKDGAIVTSLPDGYAGQVCGLCGNANADVRDDFTTKHHVSAKGKAASGEFLASWSLPTPVERRRGQAPPACTNRPAHVAARVTEMCRYMKKDRNLQACLKSLKNSWVFHEICSQQMCSCYGSAFCYCDAYAAVKLACELHNVSLSHLPGKACEGRCPPGMVFHTCGPVVTPRCSIRKTIDDGPCVPGCFCPADRVLHNGRCIEKQECPAESLTQFERT